MKRPIDYEKQSCDTMMRTYEAAKLPPVGHFHYHQGVFLSGMLHVYQLVKDRRYEAYIKDWVDSVIGRDGTIKGFEEGSLDDIQPGILLLYLYEKFGEVKYKTAIETLIGYINKWKTNARGGFWHKEHLPNEMWLDGLYMAGPFMAEYAEKYSMPALWDLVVKQALLMHENMTDSKTGLMYHAWSSDKAAIAGNWPEISCSSLYVYALSKAIRMGLMDASYLKYVRKGYEGVIGSLEFDGDALHVVGVCIGTGVCTYQGYIERPTSCNDLHGVGAFLLMCAEVERNFGLF